MENKKACICFKKILQINLKLVKKRNFRTSDRYKKLLMEKHKHLDFTNSDNT